MVKPSFGTRLRGIEGLRALAACSVLVFHSWLYSAPDGEPAQSWLLSRVLPDLAFGVVLFFTLSGFLLYRPFAAAIVSEKPLPSARAYLRNRALRILPAYLVILLAVSLILQTAWSRNDAGDLKAGELTDLGLLARSVFLVQNYTPSSTLTGIGPAWSLAIELVFYVALPLLALFAFILARSASTRAGRQIAALAPALLLLAIGISGRLAAGHLFPGTAPFAGWGDDWHSVLERSFWCNADLFSFGMALAVLRVDVEQGRVRFARRLRRLAAPIGLAAYLLTATMTGMKEQLSYSFYNTLMAVAFTCLLALVVLPSDRGSSRLVRFLDSRPLVWGGLISYSLFLWHEPLVLWLERHGLTAGGQVGFVASTVLLLTVAAVLSTVTYRFVERPALRLKSRGKRASSIPQLPAPETS